MTSMATLQRKNPYPGVHEIYNFGRPFLGHHYCILSLSDLCLGIEKKIFISHMATPCTRTAAPGVMKVFILVQPFLGHLMSDFCLGVEKKIFIGIMHFHYMTYIATHYHKNPCPRGHENYNFGKPLLGHHYFILSLFDLCLGVQKKIFLKE